MNLKKSTTCVLWAAALLLATAQAKAKEDYPQALGDLVYRESYSKFDQTSQIYGRDGVSFSLATSHPGHVGVYLGNGEVAEALATTDWWFGTPVLGEVMCTPLQASVGAHSFYELWSDARIYDGIEDHGHMGAKTHSAFVNNPNAQTLRQNIVMLALNQVGEGYDNDFSDQKGPGNDQWTCVGFAEKVYESCAGRVIIPDPANYGDQSPYAGGLNITPDGYEFHLWALNFHYQNNVEFSQVPSNPAFGRLFGLGTSFIFFPYTQFEQSTLVDSFPVPPRITSVSPAALPADSSPQLITIRGVNFKGPNEPNSSTLVFYDPADNPTPARTPDYRSSTELLYTARLPVSGPWKVKVMNGSLESPPFTFTVKGGGAQLTGLSISGPATVAENNNGEFTSTAYFSDGSSSTVTSSTAWSENSNVTSISSTGLLSAGSVSSDTLVTVSASYAVGGVTRTASANVTIVNSGGGGETQTQELIVNGDFSLGSNSWQLAFYFYADNRFSSAHSPGGYAYLSTPDGSPGNGLYGELSQYVTIPANATKVTLSYWYRISTAETGAAARDTITLSAVPSFGGSEVIDTRANTHANSVYEQRSFDISRFKGQRILLRFVAITDTSLTPTTFRIDDVSVQATVPPAVTLSSLAINGPSAFTEGSTAQYSATALFSDGSTQTVTPNTWGENSSVTTISNSGLVTAGQVNTDTAVTLYASYTYGGITREAYKDVTVINQAVTFSYLAISGPNSIDENSAGQFAATAIFSDGSSESVSPSWSDNSSATTISTAGVLTAGEVDSDTMVTVSASHTIAGVARSADQEVTIVNRPAPPQLTLLAINGPSSVTENSTEQYTATAFFTDGSSQTVNPTWSEDSQAATISQQGLLGAGDVASDTRVNISASYTAGGTTQSAQRSVTIVAGPQLGIEPTDGLTASGNQGGPFNPASRTYTVSNTGGDTLNWTAVADKNWVTVTPANGQNSGTATVSFNNTARTLSGAVTGAVYSATVIFSGNGATITRPVQLTVYAITPPPAGSILFDTHSDEVNARAWAFWQLDPCEPLTGDKFLAQLYIGKTLDQLAPAGTAVPFGTGPEAGYVHGGEVQVSGAAPGSWIYVQVRFWETSFTSYESAQAGGGKFGISFVLATHAGGVNTTQDPPITYPIGRLYGLSFPTLLTGEGCRSQVRLQIELQPSSVNLRWEMEGYSTRDVVVPQEADTPAGPWRDIVGPWNPADGFSNPPNPLSLPKSNTPRFYRLRVTPSALDVVTPHVLKGPIVNPANGHRYYLLDQNTWTRGEAEALALGGHLATVNDAAENTWIAKTFPAPFYYLWIGLNDVAQEGNFVWSSGEAATFRNWYQGEPNNYAGHEDHVLIYNFDSAQQKWNDVDDLDVFGTDPVFPIYGVAEVP